MTFGRILYLSDSPQKIHGKFDFLKEVKFVVNFPIRARTYIYYIYVYVYDMMEGWDMG